MMSFINFLITLLLNGPYNLSNHLSTNSKKGHLLGLDKADCNKSHRAVAISPSTSVKNHVSLPNLGNNII